MDEIRCDSVIAYHADGNRSGISFAVGTNSAINDTNFFYFELQLLDCNTSCNSLSSFLVWKNRRVLLSFRFAAVGALTTAGLACFSIFISMALKIPDMKDVHYGGANFSSASLAFGTILFAYSAVYMFPTIQNDMKDRQQFKKATILSFIGIMIFYLPVIITGYAVLGSAVPVNILMAIDEGYFRSFIEACLALHIFLAFLLAINPVAQEIEEVFKIKPNFNYKRCIIRSTIVTLILVVAYTIPHFDKILNLIGGSTMTLLSFILPPLFYLLLVKKGLTDTKSDIPIHERIFMYQIMITGCIGAITCTYFAVGDIIDTFIQDPSAESKGDHGIPI
ncbi:unnamed protein product [Larinioides sclopetarius]|uniref:Amino acid transporter transmembrane domain-containing protein n=1 Tax=Larinioides sclopetarius TaxID=280406 RepID=A0AAV1ZQS7_9ARAC